MMHPNATLYSNETARWMVRFARAAYMSQPEAFRWLMDFDMDFVDLNLIEVDNSQACVITHPTFVVASFRGTDDIKDVIDSINARRYYAHELEGAVHRGFYEALDRVWLEVWAAVETAREESEAPLPLWLTGHSLGGAMATLAATNLMSADVPFYGLYTFGSPRVLDRQQARIFNAEAGARTFRFQNNNDLITRVPTRLMQYSHVGQLRYIFEDGRISFEPGYWLRFLDSVKGAIDDVGELGLDGIKDHEIVAYGEPLEAWA